MARKITTIFQSPGYQANIDSFQSMQYSRCYEPSKVGNIFCFNWYVSSKLELMMVLNFATIFLNYQKEEKHCNSENTEDFMKVHKQNDGKSCNRSLHQ